LGPLRYIIYIHDLPDSLNVDSIYIYMLMMLNYSDIYLPDSLSLPDDINKLTHWTDEWLIKLNINKCKVVSYGRNIDHNYPYHINAAQLEQLDSIQDLGVNFDSQSKFYKHIANKINKVYSFLSIIKRNCTYLDKDA